MKTIKKKCSVIMLPTEDRSDIIINKPFSNKSLLQFRPDLRKASDKLRSGWTNQHLYITSDDEIKDGEWCIMHNTSIRKFQEKVKYSIPCKKIIATTNEFLTKPGTLNINRELNYNLPQLPQLFIKKYCELGGIDEVLVEYEKVYSHTDKTGMIGTPNRKVYNNKLKVTPQNEVFISLIKNSYTKKEVEILIKNALLNETLIDRDERWMGDKLDCVFYNLNKEKFEEWKRENL